MEDRLLLSGEAEQILIVQGEIAGRVEVRVVLHIGCTYDLQVALHQQDQEFQVCVQQPLSEFPTAGLVQEHQPSQHPPSIEMVLAPAVQVDHVAHLLGGSQRQQIHRIGKTDLLEGIEEHFHRQRPGQLHAVTRREDQLPAGFGVNADS